MTGLQDFQGAKFLIVLGQYSKLGGAERQALILADELIKSVGCKVAFLAWSGEGRIAAELAARNIKAWVFPLRWRGGVLNKAARLWSLARFIRREIQPDYLLPYIGFNCKIIGLVWRRTGARYTWWNQRDEGREIHGSALERWVIRTIPDIVSNSVTGQEFLCARFSLSPDQVQVINNGIEPAVTGDRESYRAKLGLGPLDLLMTMVANLTRYKDHFSLLRAFALLRADEQSGLHLLLVGRLAENTQSLKALAFDLGLGEYVHFMGEATSLEDCYAATDILVHSSFNEGCPNAVLEAMAHGLPVCGTDIPGIRQALGVEPGDPLLAAPEDAESLAHAMQLLIGDPALRKELGRRNRLRISAEFSPSQLSANVLDRIRARQR